VHFGTNHLKNVFIYYINKCIYYFYNYALKSITNFKHLVLEQASLRLIEINVLKNLSILTADTHFYFFNVVKW